MSYIPDVLIRCEAGLCDGSGWIPVHALHSRQASQYGASYKTREWLRGDQIERLERLIDPQKQVIYDGVRRCACNPAVVRNEEETPKRRRK